jgi:hypothetical protein
MVLLENFGAEPFNIKIGRPNCCIFVYLLRRKVAQSIMPGIPKFWKESHPERAKDERKPIFSHLLSNRFGTGPGGMSEEILERQPRLAPFTAGSHPALSGPRPIGKRYPNIMHMNAPRILIFSDAKQPICHWSLRISLQLF